MKIDLFRNIDKNRFGEDNVELMDKLGNILNDNFSKLNDALNNKLTISDNFKGLTKDIQVKVNASGTPTAGGKFQVSLQGQIGGMSVIRAICTDNNSTYPTSHPFISYTQTTNLVTINNITGLQADTLYDLRIEIAGE
jgi:hypothetical protein